MRVHSVNLKEAFPTLPETVSEVSFTVYLQDNQSTFGTGTFSALINPHCARWVPMCTEGLGEIWSN